MSKRFTKLHNDVMEALYLSDLTAPCIRIVLLISRLSHGYRKSRASISHKEVSEKIGIPLSTVRKSFRTLIESKVIEVHEQPKAWSRGVYSIESDVKKWLTWCPQMVIKMVSENGHNNDPLGCPQMVTKMAANGHKDGRKWSQQFGANTDKQREFDESSPENLKENLQEIRDERDQNNPDPVSVFTHKIYKAFSIHYFPITGAPHAKLADCRRFVQRHSSDIETLRHAFNTAWLEQLAYDQKVGKNSPVPFRILDRAEALIRDGLKAPQKVEYYYGDDA